MGKIAYVECERELGETYYSCGACQVDLTRFIKKNLKTIIFGFLEKKMKPFYLYCPKCNKRLDFSKLGVSISIGIKSLSIKVKKSRDVKKDTEVKNGSADWLR